MQTQVHLVRHGETAWSLSGQHTGSTNIGLTAHGQAQARGLAPLLGPLPFTQVLSSPRLRARQTCELAGLGQSLVVEPDLAEWDYGQYEGRRTADIWLDRPGWNVWRDGCPGGETPVQVSARADRLVTHLCSLQGPIVLFSHGQFGAALAMRWIGLPILAGQHFALHPASLSVLGHDIRHPGRRLIEQWNQSCASPDKA